jgi:hypothetical protein
MSSEFVGDRGYGSQTWPFRKLLLVEWEDYEP